MFLFFSFSYAIYCEAKEQKKDGAKRIFTLEVFYSFSFFNSLREKKRIKDCHKKYSLFIIIIIKTKRKKRIKDFQDSLLGKKIANRINKSIDEDNIQHHWLKDHHHYR